jgi:glycine betaine catabolism B
LERRIWENKQSNDLKYLDTSELNNSVFYICGPHSMLKAMQSLLQEELEVPKERIKVEEFTGY